MIRVLFVNTATRPPLGADMRVHAQILASLDRSTHELHAACDPGTPGHPTPTFEVLRTIAGLRLLRVRLGAERADNTVLGGLRWLFGAFSAAAGIAKLTWYSRRHQIDVIHTADRPRDALACVIVARLARARSIVHAHVAYGEWMSPLLRWALRQADGLITVSGFVAGTLIDSGHDPARIDVVWNGIDPRPWQPGCQRRATRESLGLSDATPVVITVCRLFPEKGPAELVRALQLVRADHPDVRLLVVGQEMTPGFAGELRALAEELELTAHVELLGHREDVAHLMAASDVFAMPSLEEPFGLVFLEAMAMALPVVALDSGGAPEIIDDGQTGLLCDPGDVIGLAKRLSGLLGDSVTRWEMGSCGRARVEQYFTTEQMAAGIDAAYQRVARHGARAGEQR